MTASRYLDQPSGVEWPTRTWPRGTTDSDVVTEVADELFGPGTDQASDPGQDPGPHHGVSLALVVVHRGRLVHERYGTIPAGVFAPATPVDASTPLISWSMAKSITHALTGLAVADGLLDIDDPAGIADWKGDARSEITLRHLLQMRDGLDFVEDYVIGADGSAQSDVIAMLFGEGAGDVAAYARSRPAKHVPGSFWSYSSGTTNILSSVLGRSVGGREPFETFMKERLFRRIGMNSAEPTFDDAGTFIGSSYVHATAQDFARFGYLYLRGGLWEGDRILDSSWVDDAQRQHATDPDSGHGYGSHWWIWSSRPGTLAALGYEGQRTIIDFERDLVVVHLGKWLTETQPTLDAALSRVVEAFPGESGRN